MKPAVMDVTRVDIQAGPALFRATGSVVKFPGFTIYTARKKKKKFLLKLKRTCRGSGRRGTSVPGSCGWQSP
jgi:DNA topoisomerase IA